MNDVWHDSRVAALLVLGCTGLLALSAYAGPVPLALAVALVQIVLIVGWFAVLDVPGARGGTIVAALAALVADGLLLLQTLRDGDPGLEAVAVTLGFAVLAAFVHQIARRGGRPEVVASITTTLTVTAIAVLGALLLPAGGGHGSAAAVAAVVAGAGLAAASALLRFPVWITASVGVGLAVIAGAVIGATAAAVGGASGAALGAGAAVLAILGVAVARLVTSAAPLPPVEPVLRLAVPVLLPVLLAAPAGYVLSRVLIV